MALAEPTLAARIARRATRARSPAPFPSSRTSRPRPCAMIGGRSTRRPGRAYLIGVTGPARRRQEHARRSADGRVPHRPGRRSACSPSIRRARTPAARSSAIACACRRTPRTRACSSAAWRRAGIWAAWRARRRKPRIVLDAAGFDVVIIETVGVGQDEVDIVRTADIAIVTVVPGAGDDVQALKAGIMEIADIFVVNKADREGADRTAASIEAMLSLEEWPSGAWRPPVLRTVATTGAGVPELVATIDRFRAGTGDAAGRAAAGPRRMAAPRDPRPAVHAASRARGARAGRVRDACSAASRRARLDRVRGGEPVLARALELGVGRATLDHVGVAVPEAAAYVALLLDALRARDRRARGRRAASRAVRRGRGRDHRTGRAALA